MTTLKCRKRVGFDTTEVREYPIIFDVSRCDEPVMLTLAWEYASTDVTTVQEYDLVKLLNRGRLLPDGGDAVRRYEPVERFDILMRAGFSSQDLGGHLKDLKCNDQKEDARVTAHPKKKTVMSLFSFKKDPARAVIEP